MNQILATNTFENILIDKAQGSWFWDINDNKYLDLTSGMWCCNIGHNHPKVVQAIKNQMDKIIHKNTRFLTPTTLEAAECILDFVPNNYDKITLLNSGSEAMEFAIGFAIKASKKFDILSLKDSYLGAYGLSKESSYTSQKASKLKIPYPVCDTADCNCLEEHDSLINHIIENYASKLACFVLEPIMVSGGIVKPCTNFIEKLCKLLQEVGVLIVVDEITTGFGRVGKKFGYECHGIKPDIVVLGKSLGNGYPVSAIITNANVESKISTNNMYYAQSHQLDPLGAAAALSVVEVFHNEQIIEKSLEKIKIFNDFFDTLSHPCISEIRTYGMTFGIQIQPHANHSTNNLILSLKNKLLEEGIMVGISLGKDLIRLLPPLNISEQEIGFFTQKTKQILNHL
jgi:acetylornithine aminotransferase